MSDNEVEAIAGMSLEDSTEATGIPTGSYKPPSNNDDSGELDEAVLEQISRLEQQLLDVYDRQSRLFDSTKELVAPPEEEKRAPSVVLPIHKPHAYPCMDTHKVLPTDPIKWPQAPVMLRPTPHGGTKIRGLRLANSLEYQHFSGFCAGCILPVNTGSESEGNSLVIDFESKHFVGTLLMRIRDAPPANKKSVGDTSYFDGKKRKFQAVVKGRFKTELPMTECVTGQAFDRPAGKLPARWIISSFIRFVSTLAPQMQATLDGNHPRFTSPLVATAHTVVSKPANQAESPTKQHDISEQDQEKLDNYNLYAGSKDIEQALEEPPATDSTSVFQQTTGVQVPNNATKSVSSRQGARKKCFNSLFAKKSKQPKFDLSKEYTFEFYQHLLDFDQALALDMGRAIGKIPLAAATDGQPLKFMAAHLQDDDSLNFLWCFDIWHESLYEHAQQAVERGY